MFTGVHCVEGTQMLQWNVRLIAVIALVVLVAVLVGFSGFGDEVQFGW